MTTSMKVLWFTRIYNQATQNLSFCRPCLPCLNFGFEWLLIVFSDMNQAVGVFMADVACTWVCLYIRSHLETLEPQCWQERSECILLKDSSLKIKSLFLSAFLHFKAVVVTWSIPEPSEGEPGYKVYYSALIHKIKSSVRRLVYLTLYNFIHSISSANRRDSTGDNNLSLSLYPVEATDLITSLLTNISCCFADVNYPFLSVSHSD